MSPNIREAPGLSSFARVEKLYISQSIKVLEVVDGIDATTKFKVRNTYGDLLFVAYKEYHSAANSCFGSTQTCTIHLKDTNNRTILRYIQSHRKCLPQTIAKTVEDEILGYINKKFSFRPKFKIKNQNNLVILTIKPPFRPFKRIIQCNLYDDEKDYPIGVISWRQTRFFRQMFAEADYYTVTFPMNLDLYIKALILGACFLINVMYFE